MPEFNTRPYCLLSKDMKDNYSTRTSVVNIGKQAEEQTLT